jgi:hypothetical protein
MIYAKKKFTSKRGGTLATITITITIIFICLHKKKFITCVYVRLKVINEIKVF